MGLAPCWCASALRVGVMAAIERHLIRRLGGWRPLRLSIMRMLNVGLYTTLPKDRVTGNRNHRTIMENGRVNFTMSIALDTVVFQFTALILTPQIQEAASEALDEDELEMTSTRS